MAIGKQPTNQHRSAKSQPDPKNR